MNPPIVTEAIKFKFALVGLEYDTIKFFVIICENSIYDFCNFNSYSKFYNFCTEPLLEITVVQGSLMAVKTFVTTKKPCQMVTIAATI